MVRETPIATMVEQMLTTGVEVEVLLKAVEDAELALRRRLDRKGNEQSVATSGGLTIVSSENGRGKRLPSNWSLPPHCRDYALRRGMDDGRVTLESEKFKNYWTAKTGAAATKRDWDATWRNWVLNALERNYGSSYNGRNGISNSRRPTAGADAILAGMGRIATRLVENRHQARPKDRQVSRGADVAGQLEFDG
jgi:hypothetical protein